MTDSPFAVVVADTAPLLHFFDPDSKQRDAVGQALDASPHMVVSPFVLGELDYLLTVRLGVNASLKALDHVVQMTSIVRWSVPEVAPHLHEARHLVHRYQSMDGGSGIGLTDAVRDWAEPI